jgi:hypothetical protein
LSSRFAEYFGLKELWNTLLSTNCILEEDKQVLIFKMLAEVIGSATGNSGRSFRGRVSRSISANSLKITEMLMKCQFL